MPLRQKIYYEEQAHRLLRRFIAARDAYVALVNRDDVTHPVCDAHYEQQFLALRALIADALAAKEEKS
jgi:hypothetical protein